MLAGLSLACALLLQRCLPTQAAPPQLSYQQYMAGKVVIGCGPGADDGFNWRNEDAAIPALPGWGSFAWHVTTNSDSAQYFFNQGISMYYSFHMVEAKASFARAADFDPDCSMALWGLAMSYGTNINYAAAKTSPQAFEAAAKARSSLNNESALEKALVGTLGARYNADTTLPRKKQNEDYAAAMELVYRQYPGDANVASLYADALMVQHPWDLYYIDGEPKPWTMSIVIVLEKGLKENTNHPALNHYYIHAVEGGKLAERGLPNAWRLSTMMPMVSHMVHMPSHIFIRTGHYREGMLVNDSSIKGFEAYTRLYPKAADDAFLYLLHNQHMKAACTMYRASQSDAAAAAANLANLVPGGYMTMYGGVGNYLQYMYSTPVFMQIRFGWWDSLLAAKPVGADLKYAALVQQFGRGMAFARKNDLRAAQGCLANLQQNVGSQYLKEQFETYNPAYKTVEIMISLLEGNMAVAKNDLPGAQAAYEKAVKLEDALVYQEPRDWLLPTRHFLGPVLLKQGKLAEAAKCYEKELIINPANVWSLKGLHQAQLQLKQDSRAAKTREAFQKAAQGGDITVKGSVM